MKLQEVLDGIEWFDDADRERILRPLLKLLCPVSKQTIIEYQTNFFQSTPSATSWLRFVNGLNKTIRECILLEVSDLGTAVRQQFGLNPIRLDDEVVDLSVLETIKIMTLGLFITNGFPVAKVETELNSDDRIVIRVTVPENVDIPKIAGLHSIWHDHILNFNDPTVKNTVLSVNFEEVKS